MSNVNNVWLHLNTRNKSSAVSSCPTQVNIMDTCSITNVCKIKQQGNRMPAV